MVLYKYEILDLLESVLQTESLLLRAGMFVGRELHGKRTGRSN